MIISRVQAALISAGSVLLLLVGAYGLATRAAKRSMEIDSLRRRAKVQEKVHEVDTELSGMDDRAVRDRLRKFVRTR